jgi:hypothetical protein
VNCEPNKENWKATGAAVQVTVAAAVTSAPLGSMGLPLDAAPTSIGAEPIVVGDSIVELPIYYNALPALGI